MKPVSRAELVAREVQKLLGLHGFQVASKEVIFGSGREREKEKTGGELEAIVYLFFFRRHRSSISGI